MDNDVLRQAPLFSALDDEAAAALRASMAENRLRRGEVLFHEGDAGDKLYIVTDGKVKLGRTSSDGRENLLAILGPGQMFGELSLFDPGPRSATVTAVTDTAFLSLSHDDLLRWLEGRPASRAGCSPSSPAGCARPTTSSPTWSSPTSRAGSPRRCSTSPTGSAAPPTTACTCTTTSPRRSSPSWSAPPARPSTRRSPTSPRAAGCGSSPAPS